MGRQGRPCQEQCVSASGITIASPLCVPHHKVWRQTPCKELREPHYRRHVYVVYKELYLVAISPEFRLSVLTNHFVCAHYVLPYL